MRVDAVKINRSGVYYLINTVAPINHELKAEFDAIGSVIVVGLFLGIVSLVRFVLVGCSDCRTVTCRFLGRHPGNEPSWVMAISGLAKYARFHSH